MEQEISLTVVGRISHEAECDAQFHYRGKAYKKLLDWDHFDAILGKKNRFIKIYASRESKQFQIFKHSDPNQQTGFYLKREQINDIEHLVLCYRNLNRHNSYRERQQKSFLINAFFEFCDESEREQRSEMEFNALSLDDFYDRLKKAHESDDLETGIPANVQHRSLRPILRPYQVKGIKWMLKRELKADYLPTCYIKLKPKFNKAQIFYYNIYSQRLVSERPEIQEIPPGGLLTGSLSNVHSDCPFTYLFFRRDGFGKNS